MIRLTVFSLFFCLAFLLTGAGQAATPAAGQEWEIIIPTGEIQKASIDPAPRIGDLAGKTVVLRWNGKNNGDALLNFLAERLRKKYPTANLIKSYELDKSINIISASQQGSMRITEIIKGLKPDLVIASQAD